MPTSSQGSPRAGGEASTAIAWVQARNHVEKKTLSGSSEANRKMVMPNTKIVLLAFEPALSYPCTKSEPTDENMNRYPIRYVIPNAITCLGLTIGIVSVFRAMSADYTGAAWLVIVCVLVDKMDGSVARLLNASSEFGVQLDSFSDFISFGVAPGFLLHAILTDTDAVGGYYTSSPTLVWALRVIVVVFILASCLRLAKFNVLTEKIGKRHFLGIPTTLSGAIVCTYVLTAVELGWPPVAFYILPPIYLCLSLLMVSNFKLPKAMLPENLVLRATVIAMVGSVYLFGFLRWYPAYLFALATGFCIFGLIYGALFMKAETDSESPEDAD